MATAELAIRNGHTRNNYHEAERATKDLKLRTKNSRRDSSNGAGMNAPRSDASGASGVSRSRDNFFSYSRKSSWCVCVQ